MVIREIRVVEPEGRYTFEVITRTEQPRISSNFTPSFLQSQWKGSEQINFPTTPRRLIQLANEILNHYNKKAKYEEWKPTFNDLEAKLLEIHGEDGFYFWIIDWLRTPQHADTAKRLKDWLNTAEDLGFFTKKSE